MKVKQLLSVLLGLLPLLVFSACSDNGSSNISDESNDDPALEENIDNGTSIDESSPSDTNTSVSQAEVDAQNSRDLTEYCYSLPTSQQLACTLNQLNP